MAVFRVEVLLGQPVLGVHHAVLGVEAVLGGVAILGQQPLLGPKALGGQQLFI